ncbi:MAG: hydrophobe/amphiphile efflux-1 family RND transporter [Candidatus Eremiobacter antarcticus]|nr:multidrug efflux RND transporter permease subunit [Candidatus Eremiobacteraeota bacterium]MBC5807055.1 multidrug efflux RND transporter permease subunit [Candidatus Eremiobacteraeota bacterium]PZR62817.1 MAG: hydrophobe/amphiphile efflux-1 family RND transporter [Candidatus Eremiobacter sp. RRmetagenome_bin22]
MFSSFFITRPIFASVCAAIILLIGAIAIPSLPVSHYPSIAPPTVTVQAEYIGANAEAVESSVTNPLEEQINGVEGLRYLSSTSADDGSSQITATFNLGRDPDKAAQDVQTRVNVAQGVLPAQVKQTGITVNKNSSSFVMAIGITSDNKKYDSIFLSNYADRYITQSLKRVKGVGNVIIFGERKYAMRLWLDPSKLQAYALTPSDVVTALQQQNVQVAAGAIGQQPAPPKQPYQLNVRVAGRLTSPAEFANIVVKSASNNLVRVADVGRVDLGAQDYSTNLNFNGKTATGIGVLQLQDANSLSVSKGVNEAMERLSKDFPPGVHYAVAFDSTVFVHESIREVMKTLLIAIALVVLVIFLFLQDWPTTMIPAITIPVSLFGTFGLLKAFGFSINVLTLFGLTLATALVVDDAIVVIENIVRYIQEHKKDPKTAAPLAMAEITSAVVATSLVLLAVFVPVAFFPGTTGELYKQFALTIASTITISAFTALTLAPALASLLLKSEEPAHGPFMRGVARGINAIRNTYRRALPQVVGHRAIVLTVFALLLAATVFMLKIVPTGFVPDEDQGYFVVIAQGPPGSSLDYTDRIMAQAQRIMRSESDVVNIFSVSGFSFTGVGANNGIMFCLLKPWADRKHADQTAAAILGRLGGKLIGITGASVFAFNPPAIQGAGNVGGFDFEVEDQANLGLPALASTAGAMMYRGNTDPALRSVFTTFRVDNPQVQLNIDRDAVQALHVKLGDVFDTLQIMLGSDYVNDFNYNNKSYRVYVQADAPYRSRVDDLSRMYVRSESGAMIPLNALMAVQRTLGPPVIYHYDLFRSIEFNGNPAPGYSSGQALSRMQTIASQVLPKGMSYAWTGVSRDQIEAANATILIFGLAVIFVFLVLAAQYESLVDPLIIIMAVPLAILGALTAIWLRGLQNDIFTQIGLVMLVGLASKNAILIVQFGNLLRQQGMPVAQAALQAAQTRLRPILMTSFAFIFGIMPLVFATGAGEASRHSLGTAVVGGMLVSTLLNLFVIPLLYVIIAGAEERYRERRAGRARAVRPAYSDEG